MFLKYGLIAAIFALSLYFIYRPSFTNPFWGDDYYNIWIARAGNIGEVADFFNLTKKSPEFPFYRPLTTQLFYYLVTANATVFDPQLAHIIMFLLFLSLGIMVYWLTRLLFKSRNLGFLTVFFYIFSGSHFYRLYYLSQFQEMGLAFFFLLSVIMFLLWLKKPKRLFYFISVFSFISGLAAKESILLLNLILPLLLIFKGKLKQKWFSLWPFFVISGVYAFLRLVFFGIAYTGHYQMVFSPKLLLNTYFWYFLWSFGFPEDLVNLDLFNKTSLINPRILINFGENGAFAILLLLLFVLLCLLGVNLIWKERNQLKSIRVRAIIFGLAWFGLTLLMVAFYPFHKFIYSLTLPLYGVALILAVLALVIGRFSKIFLFIFVFFYFYAQMQARSYAFDTHWSIKRGVLSQAWFYYLEKYPDLPGGAVFYIREFSDYICRPVEYPLTRELDHALSNDKAVKLRLGEDKQVFYDYNTTIDKLPQNNGPIYEIDIRDIMSIGRQMGGKF